MNKCIECGHIFEDCESAIREEQHPYGSTQAIEASAVCPICGGDFVETVSCKKCRGAFLEEELIEGYCEECLRESVTYDNFLAFATSGARNPDDVDTLEDFMLRDVFEIGGSEEILMRSSPALKSFLRNIYSDFVKADEIRKRFTGKGTLVDSIRVYLTDFKIWYSFAEYLTERRKADEN